MLWSEQLAMHQTFQYQKQISDIPLYIGCGHQRAMGVIHFPLLEKQDH